jgi:hypothetical protein
VFAFPADGPSSDILPVHSLLHPISARINQELNQLPVGLPNCSTIPSTHGSDSVDMLDFGRGIRSIDGAYLATERDRIYRIHPLI